jgi:hypothetical protein
MRGELGGMGHCEGWVLFRVEQAGVKVSGWIAGHLRAWGLMHRM